MSFYLWLFALLWQAEEPYRFGAGVTPPRLVRKAEPEYTSHARAARIQGACVIEIVVDVNGKATDLEVISPLGYGLDEQALAAIRRWEFEPGEKDGKPVKVLATVEVAFRLMDGWHDSRAERQRTAFNVALRGLERKEPKRMEEARRTILDLAKQKFPPAMYVQALWARDGDVLPKDEAQSARLLKQAADRDYGPALYEVGRMHLEGRGAPVDAAWGMQLVRDASILGSTAAQFYLGWLFETGGKVPVDAARARQYYRLCAARGQADCQFRLGRLLLAATPRRQREYVQAVAWLELAAARDFAQAKTLLAQEAAGLTTEQRKWVDALKERLAGKD